MVGRHKMVRTIDKFWSAFNFGSSRRLCCCLLAEKFVGEQVGYNVSTATQEQLVSRPNILFVYLIHFGGLHGRSVTSSLYIFETCDVRVLNFLNFHSWLNALWLFSWILTLVSILLIQIQILVFISLIVFAERQRLIQSIL